VPLDKLYFSIGLKRTDL